MAINGFLHKKGQLAGHAQIIMLRNSDISELIEYFVRRKDGFAYWKSNYVWLRLRIEPFDNKQSLTVDLQLRYDGKEGWGGTASTIAGFFPDLDSTKRWLQSEEGFDRINHCLQELERVSNKEPYEDWDR